MVSPKCRPESRQRTARSKCNDADAKVVAWIPLPRRPVPREVPECVAQQTSAPHKSSLTLTLSRLTGEGTNVEARCIARQRSAKNYWVQSLS
jgi:hypothetical protein